MPARINKILHDPETKYRIRARNLLNLLADYAEGKPYGTGKPIVLDATRIRAIEIYVRKYIPDVTSVQLNAEVRHSYVARLPDVENTTEAWTKKYQPQHLNS